MSKGQANNVGIVVRVNDVRTGNEPKVLERAFIDHLQYSQGKTLDSATTHDQFMGLAYVVRDRLIRRWIDTQKHYSERDVRRVCYLSAEYLPGRFLAANLLSLGIYDDCKRVLGDLGIPLDSLLEEESDAGLGHGGLGHLAACILDSMATVGVPGYGYGIRYRFGFFDQLLRDGFQVERPDEWLKNGNPWEIKRPERQVRVDFYGRAEHYYDEAGQWRARWIDTRSLVGMPYDTPIAGFGNDTVNTLRLWEAAASEEPYFDLFNEGDYDRAVADKNAWEMISNVLCPNEKTSIGRELRLKQQYFFVRCSLVDIIRRHLRRHPSLDNLSEKVAIHLNGTHAAIAVAELMRILVDEHGMEWDMAWHVTREAISYTNHNVLRDTLEKWPVELLGRILPRHLQIIFEINRRFLRDVLVRWPSDLHRLSRMSLVEEGREKQIRLTHLAFVGSHSVSRVAQHHRQTLEQCTFKDLCEAFPDRMRAVSHGISPRRWLLQCNPALAKAITCRIGAAWMRDLQHLAALAPFADDAGFQRQIRAIKRVNKEQFVAFAKGLIGMSPDPDALFDMQLEQIHESKRQLLNALHIVSLYVRAKTVPDALRVPRAFFFSGKAAPGCQSANLIIKLINAIADTVAADSQVSGLSIHFIPNYRVSLAERMIPACDLAEQISATGMQAPGAANMKLAINGALTIGTLDGPNVELRDAVGPDGFFAFGSQAEQARGAGSFDGSFDGSFEHCPRALYEANAELRVVIDLIASGYFCRGNRGLFRPLTDSLLAADPSRVLADFASYVECQRGVDAVYMNHAGWDRSRIANIANMGRFSSDRTVREYASGVWNVDFVGVKRAAHSDPETTSGAGS